MTSLMQSALNTLAMGSFRLLSKSPGERSGKSAVKSLSALSLTVLFLAGGSLSAMAEPFQRKIGVSGQSHSISPSVGLSASSLGESAQLEADIQQIVEQVMAAETAHWSAAQKAALKEMASMGLKDAELEAIATLTPSEMSTQLKSGKKLSKLSATGITSEEALKLAPALLLSRYLLNIGRAALWGGVLSAIRGADFDYRAMSSALTSGNTREFMSLFRNGFATDQTRFANLVGTAATFACGSATLDITPGLCSRFSSGLQKIFTRINRPSARSTRRRSLPVAVSNKATVKKATVKP